MMAFLVSHEVFAQPPGQYLGSEVTQNEGVIGERIYFVKVLKVR